MGEASAHTDSSVTPTDDIDFTRAQKGASFADLRKTHRSFVFPLALAFLIWYLVYILLAIYAPSVMAVQVVGNINLGIVLGLLQFVTTFGITGWYVAFANRSLDPRAAALRDDMESGVYSLSAKGQE